MMRGTLFGVGVGPGDPELLTLKALRLLQAAPIVAYFAAPGRSGNAHAIIAPHVLPGQTLVRLEYPLTREAPPPGMNYETLMSAFYDRSAQALAAHLDAGQNVAVVCEGDPMFFGSYMYLHDRLAGQYRAEVVPGVSSIFAAASVLGAPLVYRNQTLSVLSGVLPYGELTGKLAAADAAVIMKLGGGNLPKVRDALRETGLFGRALYIERATMADQKIIALGDVDAQTSPYFSLILVPGKPWLS